MYKVKIERLDLIICAIGLAISDKNNNAEEM